MDGERLRIHAAKPLPLEHRQPTCTVLAAGRAGSTSPAARAVRLLSVQRDGGRPIDIGDYLTPARSQAVP